MRNESVPTSKRRAILLGAASLAAGALAGCCWLRRPLRPVCPRSPEVSDLQTALTIDAHCHVFNGTDLQIREFLSRVLVNQDGTLGEIVRLLAGLLEQVNWSTAPTGETELRELKNIATALEACEMKGMAVGLSDLRQDGYRRGRAELQAAVRLSPEFRALGEHMKSNAAPLALNDDARAKAEAIDIIEALPETVDDYTSSKAAKSLTLMSTKGRSVAGMIDFVLQNFQYRYVSVHDYLHTYNQPGERVVDLMLPSMVDYDWWLARGGGTPTLLATQIEVMQAISMVTGGRVHAFVPYDPLRQVAFELHHTHEDSFALVTAAIEKNGCVGVKLYPPMGFAALGNSALANPDGTSFWARPWLPDWTARPDMGSLLDRAMRKILAWCEKNHVPVMAHTNISNGPSHDFEELAGAQYWGRALNEFKALRVSFGHFGDTAPVGDGLARTRAFARLMNADAAQPGAFAYADAGYFVEVIDKNPQLRDLLRVVYDETAGKGDAALANRFMYGTDWEMTLAEGSVDTYLSGFEALMDELEARPASQAKGLRDFSLKFFGMNAAKWIGLHRGEKARDRLDAFYARNGMSEPDWAQKLDRGFA